MQILEPQETSARLEAVGVPLAATVLVSTPDEARQAAQDLTAERFVVKAGGLLHKSDEGGVLLGLDSPEAVRTAAEALVDRLGARATPLVVQEQREGLEMLVGLRRVDSLGTVLVVGLGGVHTEIFRDVARALVPVHDEEARAMVERLRALPLLLGTRGEAPRDIDALCRLLVRVSDLAERHDDISELDLNPVLVGHEGEGVVGVDARILTAPPAISSRPASRDLDRLLRPDHIAVVGVSDDQGKFGAKLFRYLARHGFAGRIDAIHPAGGTVNGRQRHRSLRDLDAAPDLVCVAVPARRVADVARDAVAVGAGGVLVHSSDFAEIGEEGERLQRELVQVLRDGGVPLAGPNDMGFVSPGRRMAASISGALVSVELLPGTTALVTSSGALGSCLATRLMGSGVGLSHWLHVGNEADLVVADYLEWLADDPETQAVGMLLEDIKEGPRFVAAARRLAAAGKPTFAYNMVRSEKGQAAARSHTGAMVGSYDVRQEALRSGCVVSVPTLRVLEDALQLAAAHDLPAGSRLMAVTFSGGACTIIADEAERLGLELPDLSRETQAEVQRFVPSFAAVRNPLDVSFQMVNNPERFRGVMSALLDSGAFDAALIQFTTNADPTSARTAEAVLTVRDMVKVPVFVARYGGEQLAPEGLRMYADASVPVLDAPDRAVQAIGALSQAAAAIARARHS